MNPVQQLLSHTGRFFAVLDGPCGSGKTTLSAHLEQCIPNLYVVHMDDYYIPFSAKTPERLAIPGGNADSERLIREVLTPYLKGEAGLVRPYSAHEDRYLPGWTLPPDGSLLIEGSYSGLPQISEHADDRFYLTISPSLQRERILKRNGSEIYRKFVEMWIPLENAYHRYYHLPSSNWQVLDQPELENILKG